MSRIWTTNIPYSSKESMDLIKEWNRRLFDEQTNELKIIDDRYACQRLTEKDFANIELFRRIRSFYHYAKLTNHEKLFTLYIMRGYTIHEIAARARFLGLHKRYARPRYARDASSAVKWSYNRLLQLRERVQKYWSRCR
jgi:hypothetical protein